MRDIISISLSGELIKKIDSLVKRGGYSSRSEFLRDLIRKRIEQEKLRPIIRKN